MDVALRLHGGDLEIDRLSIGGLAGATISATGKITEFAGRPQGNVDASIVAVDLAPVIDRLAAQYPDSLPLRELDKRAKSFDGLFGDARIDLVGTVARNDDGSSGIAVSAKGTAGGSDLVLTISGNGALDALEKAPLKLSFSADNADAGALMALYGLPSLPLGLAGSGQTSLTAEGAIASGLKLALDFTGQDMQANFDGDFQIADGAGGRKGCGPHRGGGSRTMADDHRTELPRHGHGHAGIADGRCRFRPRAAGCRQHPGRDRRRPGIRRRQCRNQGRRAASDRQPQPRCVRRRAGRRHGARRCQPAAGRRQLADRAVPVEGGNAVHGRTGADVQLDRGGIFGVLEDAHMLAVIARDGVRLADVSGRLDGGELTGLLEAKNNEGTALVSTQFKLAGADLRQFLQGSGLTGSGDVTASLSASGKSVEALVASLSGSGTAAIKGASIPGVNPDALPALLAGADRVGRDIDAARTAAFAPAIVSAGTLAAPSADIAFTVAAGVLRAPPVTLDAGKAVLSADLKTDFATGSVTAAGTVAYAPGDEALAGSDAGGSFHGRRAAGGAVRHNTTPSLWRSSSRSARWSGSRLASRLCNRRFWKSSGCAARCATTHRCSSSATRPRRL